MTKPIQHISYQQQMVIFYMLIVIKRYQYINDVRQIQREQVQQLLDVCFPGQGDQITKYFIYQKFQYYVLNTINGEIQPLEIFIKNKKIIPNSNDNQQLSLVILSVSQKFLKKLNKKLQIQWSAISSTINIISARQFFTKPTTRAQLRQHKTYSFYRTGQKSIYIQNNLESTSFDLESSSTIISIFSFDVQQHKFISHQFGTIYRNKLAIGWKEHQNSSSQEKDNRIDFSNLQYFPITQKHRKHKNIPIDANEETNDSLMFCVNTFRTLKKIGQTPKINHKVQVPPTLPFSMSPDSRQAVIVNKQQPVAFIFSGIVFVAVLIFLYVIGFKKIIKQQLSKLQQKNQNKMQQLQQKLNQQILNQKQLNLIQNNTHSIKTQNLIKETQHYQIYQGTFFKSISSCLYCLSYKLSTITRYIRTSFKNIIQKYQQITLLSTNRKKQNFKKIDNIINQTSNKYISFAIFSQKHQQVLSRKNIQKIMIQKNPRQVIKQLLSAIIFIAQKITLKRILLESIIVEGNNLKINPIPNVIAGLKEGIEGNKIKQLSLLNKNQIEQKQNINEIIQQQQNIPTLQLKQDLTNILFFIATIGEHFNQSFIKNPQKIKINNLNKIEQHFILKDFMEFILNQNQSFDQFILSIENHPYLWQTKQRMLFIMDFSNYIQTHIDQYKLQKLQSSAKDHEIIKGQWIKQIDYILTKQINSHRKYDYNSVRDLIRVIRNKVSHFHQLSKQVKHIVGKTPQDFIQYFLNKFPKLLPFMYVYSKKKKWKLHT